MKEEITKIELFIEELVKQGEHNPDAASAKSFFELWENIQHPKPFRVDGDSITLAGVKFDLIPKNGVKTGCLVWVRANAWRCWSP
jgi:glyoxylase-like metal-dependent hydrolase (beta-lactamase superfamily II)